MEPGFNDVVVSEIHAKPAAFTQVPDVEFVEIHNRSASAFQLEGWTVKDATATGIATLPARILAPAPLPSSAIPSTWAFLRGSRK